MSPECSTPIPGSFADLALETSILKAIDKAGYTTPTPIQAKMIPHVLAGRDVIGQAQTGTGKTAAFALPLLHNLSPAKKKKPQIIVLAPTRELALQVAEAFQTYGQNLKHLRVLPVFGGQDYSIQLRQLERGVNVMIGTPGRVMDHIRRGTLDLSEVRTMVLDEADEMLKMGFIDDVEWILKQMPKEKQVALFSATMPAAIRRIAGRYLNNPVEISIRDTTISAPNISQQYILTKGLHNKREALQRIIELEACDKMLIFVRTKIQTIELAEFLIEHGYNAGALNGDIPQNQRLRMVEQLKSGRLNILVATDVAARGLDIDRISHVINFDIPFDTEAYIHRIGRTGRAGRAGKAILFLQAKEKSMLKSIERATGKKIAVMQMPSIAEMKKHRLEAFKEEISRTLTADLTSCRELILNYCREQDVPADMVAAALVKMSQDKSALPQLNSAVDTDTESMRKLQKHPFQSMNKEKSKAKRRDSSNLPEKGMDRYRIEIGSSHGVKPGNIVGAIANEAEISSEHIGRINIFDNYSTVDLPFGMPHQILRLLQNTSINNMRLQLKKEKAAFHQEAADTRNSSQEKRKKKKKKFTGNSSHTQKDNKSFAAAAVK